MRTFHARILAFSAALLLLGAHNASAKPHPAKTPRYPSMRLVDGLYVIADGGVTCKVAGGWINCSNALSTQLTCKDDHCQPYDSPYRPPPSELDLDRKSSPTPKHVLPVDTDFELPRVTCHTGLHHIECRVVDENGGFQMSRLFARCNNWNDAPQGWPWDGRVYTDRDRPTYVR